MATLPKTFWGEVATESSPALGESSPALSPSSVSEEAQWTASFSDLGYEFTDAMARLLNTDSAIMGKTLRTIEDVYNHLRNEAAGIIATSQIAEEPPALLEKPSRPFVDPEIKMAKQKALLAANESWRESVRQRKEAMRQWDEYVARLHKIFVDTRNGITTKP